MAALENVLSDGTPTNKPPSFDGKNYTFWKFKMEVFIKAHGYKLWNIIEKGNLMPKDELGFPKTQDEYNDEDYAMLEQNYKAILMIQSTLSQTELVTSNLLRKCGMLYKPLMKEPLV